MSEPTREEELGELRAALWPGDDWRLTWGAEFAAGLAKALPNDARVSGMLGGFLTDLGRYEEALAADERTVGLDPSDAVAWYNLACSQALLGRTDAAFASLELAAERGFADAEAMDTDSDLDSIRGIPRFAKLARAVRANADGRGEEWGGGGGEGRGLPARPPKFAPAAGISCVPGGFRPRWGDMKIFPATLRRWAAAAALWGALAAAASAQDAPAPRVQFKFEQADIRRVTELVGRLTGETFLLPDSIDGKVSILTQGPVAVEDVLPLYVDMLEASGYTIVRRGGAWQVLPLPGGASVASGDAAEGGLGVVSKIVPLQHVPAQEVKKVLEPLVRNGSSGGLEAFAAGNRLVVTDTASAVARVEALAKELDIPGAGNGVELVALRHASPDDVARQLREVFGAAETAADRVNRHMQQVTAGLAGAPPEFAVVPIPQAGSVALVGRPLQIADAKRLIERMDVESPYGFGRLHVIFLKYLPAEEAAKSLNALLGKGAADAGAAAEARRHIAIEPSVANNALLVDAAPQDFAYVSSVVAQLDVVPQQVLVEVLIAEMNLEKTHELGLEWFGVDAPEGSGSGGLVRTMYGTADGMKSLLTEGSFSSGLSLAFMSGRFTAPDGNTYAQIPLYLRAIAGDNDLKILSNIPLWAQNNREASVAVVENIPILSSSVEGSGSDRDYIQNIERQDVGIKLVLTPHVNPDNEIQIDLNPSIEAVASYGSGDAAQYTPTISKREVKTTVTVPDRATVVLSGLIREDETEVVSKVPFLGDIPLLGWLFRHTATAKKRTNLLIFVTPRIVTDPAMADAERARLERAASLDGAAAVLEEPSPAAEKKRPKPPKTVPPLRPATSLDTPVIWSK